MTTAFPEWPILQPVDNGSRYELEDDYVYEGWLTVPKGFLFDMASTPRFVWGLVSPFDLGPGALIHDYGYHVRGAFSPDTAAWTRAAVDKLFLKAMKQFKIPFWKRQNAYYAVRIFGQGRWREHR